MVNEELKCHNQINIQVTIAIMVIYSYKLLFVYAIIFNVWNNMAKWAPAFLCEEMNSETMAGMTNVGTWV